MNRASLAMALSVCAFTSAALGGQYAPAAGVTGSTAIAASSPAFRGWATGVVDLSRGYQEIDEPGLGLTTHGTGQDALGLANATVANTFPVVSLGDAGSITLSFSMPIANGSGFDFAVFENALNDSFLELAFVEVSTNGVDFVRFPSISLTPANVQINGDDQSQTFGGIDPTNLNNLAGKYRAGFGTPFDLSDLAALPEASKLDFSNIRYVRVIDVVGCIDPAYARKDSAQHVINDPWATPYDVGGFDLDGVGILNTVPEPGAGVLCLVGGVLVGMRRRRCSDARGVSPPRLRFASPRDWRSFDCAPPACARRSSAQDDSLFWGKGASRDGWRGWKCAFTLLELLIVVAILGIVATLTLAAISGARDQADAVQCASNLRALMTANFSYAADHDGQFVAAQEPSNLVRWHGVRDSTGDKFDGSKGPLAPYLGREGRVKLCPALKRALTGASSFEEGSGGYGYNAAYIGGTPNSTWTPERLAGLERPAQTVMFTDAAFARADGVQEYAYSEPWQAERPLGRFRGKLNASVHFRHSDKANVAWCDGHLSAEPYSKLDSGNVYGGDSTKQKIGWFGPSEKNGYWRPYAE
jgi:prepilin-type N-terminal cleavage/methylation domain-containing protein/prepilin-type processing-associated H-X9-DG protein